MSVNSSLYPGRGSSIDLVQDPPGDFQMRPIEGQIEASVRIAAGAVDCRSTFRIIGKDYRHSNYGFRIVRENICCVTLQMFKVADWQHRSNDRIRGQDRRASSRNSGTVLRSGRSRVSCRGRSFRTAEHLF